MNAKHSIIPISNPSLAERGDPDSLFAGLTAVEARRTYRTLSARYHPDRVKLNDKDFPDAAAKNEAIEYFKKIQEAYEAIANPAKEHQPEEEYFNPAWAEPKDYPTIRFYPVQTLPKDLEGTIRGCGIAWVSEDFESRIQSGHPMLCIGIDLPVHDKEAMRRYERFTDSDVGLSRYLAYDAFPEFNSHREIFIADSTAVNALLQYHVINAETAETLLKYTMPDMSRDADKSADYRERIAQRRKLSLHEVQALEEKGLLLPDYANELREQINQSVQR